jgi:hypothetical protein
MYGIGYRVGNEMRNGQLRCTVCNTICGSASVGAPVEKVKDQPKVESKPKEEKGKKPKPNKDKKFGRK